MAFVKHAYREERPRQWNSSFIAGAPQILDVTKVMKGVDVDGRISLITRSGFEQKHIFTSQIASM